MGFFAKKSLENFKNIDNIETLLANTLVSLRSNEADYAQKQNVSKEVYVVRIRELRTSLYDFCKQYIKSYNKVENKVSPPGFQGNLVSVEFNNDLLFSMTSDEILNSKLNTAQSGLSSGLESLKKAQVNRSALDANLYNTVEKNLRTDIKGICNCFITFYEAQEPMRYLAKINETEKKIKELQERILDSEE
ncbi:Uncharacterised protein [Candidatus Tiddalikarchaeum anstoanum]|nr:Uncharacterised protein [Candidatus Tiddalikarchaeum anstoanum]